LNIGASGEVLSCCIDLILPAQRFQTLYTTLLRNEAKDGLPLPMYRVSVAQRPTHFQRAQQFSACPTSYRDVPFSTNVTTLVGCFTLNCAATLLFGRKRDVLKCRVIVNCPTAVEHEECMDRGCMRSCSPKAVANAYFNGGSEA
jgi:hypothetical protein